MKKVKTMDCGYCPYEFSPVMETGKECPYVQYEQEDHEKEEKKNGQRNDPQHPLYR